jgi:hypothetical protein
MSDILQNDLVLIANKRVLRNLVISMDHSVERRLLLAVDVELALADNLCSDLGTWLARGLEHPVEPIANALLPVPRVLYATTNPAYNPTPACDDLFTLARRLDAFDQVASGPFVGTLRPGAELCGLPLDLPCDIPFKRDVNRRWTFLRGLFQNQAPDFIEVVNGAVIIVITGTAYQGDFFSRHLAQKTPTHEFTMRLRYEVKFINQSDVAFGRVPFQMVADPPPPSLPGLPRLPKKGQFIFARRFDGDPRHFVLPSYIPLGEVFPGGNVPCLRPEGCQPPGLTGDLYGGGMDDLLYDNTAELPFTPVPRYRVESHSPDEPERLVIRTIGDPQKTILAEARGGRLVLEFKRIEDLDVTPLGTQGGISGGDFLMLSNSITKFNPTLSRSFTCTLDQATCTADDSAMLDLSQLRLLGPRGLDIPLMPQSVVVPVEARVIRPSDTTDIIMDGFPADSVRSTVISCDLTAAQYFPATQAFGVSGKVGGAGDQVFFDFSDGRDLAIGTSQLFMQPMLEQMGEAAMEQLKDQDLPGLNAASLNYTVDFIDGRIRLRVEGEGSIETVFFLPPVDYKFDAEVKIGFRAQKAVLTNNSGDPLDRYGAVIPQEVLDALGLNLIEERLELSHPAMNPLCFSAYWDPEDGIACFDAVINEMVTVPCPRPAGVAPPVYDANLNQIGIVGASPPEDCWGQESFGFPENQGGLKHQYGLVVAPPGEDDVDVDVDVNFLSIFLVQLVSVFLAPGALVTILSVAAPAAPAFLTGFFLLPFSGLIAGAAATNKLREKLGESFRSLDTLDLGPTPFLGIFLETPQGVRQPFAIQGGPGKGAFILRNHVVVQSAGLPSGL